MIFQHTIEQVLAGKKTQTARIWKEDYEIIDDYPIWANQDDCRNNIQEIKKSGRRLHHLGKNFAIQPGRGKKAVARARITHLAKQDVSKYSIYDIQREGYSTHNQFLKVWRKMHGKNYIALVIQFELLS